MVGICFLAMDSGLKSKDEVSEVTDLARICQHESTDLLALEFISADKNYFLIEIMRTNKC